MFFDHLGVNSQGSSLHGTAVDVVRSGRKGGGGGGDSERWLLRTPLILRRGEICGPCRQGHRSLRMVEVPLPCIDKLPYPQTL